MTETEKQAGEPILSLIEVSASYGDRRVLSGVSLSIARGEIFALLGGNGAGKSTTLKVVLGFLKPDSGMVQVTGIDVTVNPAKARDGIAYVPENVALYEHLNARETLAYFLTLAGIKPDAARIEGALDAVGLASSARGQRLGGYSKGMRQKTAIALAVARDVPILLLDEPTSGLDPRAISEFHDLLEVLRGRGTAVLMVTHDLLGATQVAGRIGFLDGGRLVSVADKAADPFDIDALYRAYQTSQPGRAA